MCSPNLLPSSGRVGGNTPKGCVSIVVYRRSVTPDRPSVTELPGLTSDSIYTADRRGGILISFGPNRSPRRVINPPELVRSTSEDSFELPRPYRVPPTRHGPTAAGGIERRGGGCRLDICTWVQMPCYT